MLNFPPAGARLLLALALLGAVPAAAAQTTAETPAEAADLPDHTSPRTPDATVTPDNAASLLPSEQRVREIIQGEGLHVVHFWAPWCGNSIEELRNGWYEVVEKHPDVTFTFVTVWNDGQSGRETMEQYGLPERVVEVAAPGTGPREDKTARRRHFLGMPLTWIPSTWVFRSGGELAYAFNYGELRMEQVEQALEDARNEWAH